MFDPSTGQWFEEDPIGFAGSDPNLRRYAYNSPVNHTDLSGLQPTSPTPAESILNPPLELPAVYLGDWLNSPTVAERMLRKPERDTVYGFDGLYQWSGIEIKRISLPLYGLPYADDNEVAKFRTKLLAEIRTQLAGLKTKQDVSKLVLTETDLGNSIVAAFRTAARATLKEKTREALRSILRDDEATGGSSTGDASVAFGRVLGVEMEARSVQPDKIKAKPSFSIRPKFDDLEHSTGSVGVVIGPRSKKWEFQVKASGDVLGEKNSLNMTFKFKY